jgi:nucleotide-binding universal stress UspA family protein
LTILLGRVTQQLVEHAPCPVLIVRVPYTGMRRVLLATDGSLHSRRAAAYLARFPLPLGCEVHLIHVLPSKLEPAALIYVGRLDRLSPPLPTPELERMAARQNELEEREGRELLARTVATLRAAHYDAKPFLVRGDAAAEILQHAQHHAIDLLVAGSRGLSGIAGWWLGSVSRKLIHYAGCSVLIVRDGSQPSSDRGSS